MEVFKTYLMKAHQRKEHNHGFHFLLSKEESCRLEKPPESLFDKAVLVDAIAILCKVNFQSQFTILSAFHLLAE